jgi:hypothetical protein
MMGFWDLSDGGSAAKTGTEYEIPGGNMDPIPAGSSVLAIVDEAKWDVDQLGNQYVSLRWSVLAPEAFKNRKVFHKLWVTDHDPNAKDTAKAIAKTDKARKMLAAIDANAGGKLSAKNEKPSSDDLAMALCNKPMVITLMVWESNTGGGGGNWVCAVAPKDRELKIGEAKPAPRRADPLAGGGSAGGNYSRNPIDDEEIPFAPEWRI